GETSGIASKLRLKIGRTKPAFAQPQPAIRKGAIGTRSSIFPGSGADILSPAVTGQDCCAERGAAGFNLPGEEYGVYG
ncbi:MAG: hypothetical protein ACK4Y4_10210, partial [Brevundimonas sp.]